MARGRPDILASLLGRVRRAISMTIRTGGQRQLGQLGPMWARASVRLIDELVVIRLVGFSAMDDWFLRKEGFRKRQFDAWSQ